jgi:hypothetical protein
MKANYMGLPRYQVNQQPNLFEPQNVLILEKKEEIRSRQAPRTIRPLYHAYYRTPTYLLCRYMLMSLNK